MKLVAAKDALLNGLQLTHGVVDVRPTLPILSNVLLSATEPNLWLTTTDLEVVIRARVEAAVAKRGATTLPARRLLSVVRELPAEQVEIEADEKHAATVTCGRAFFKINGLSDEEFPPLPPYQQGNVFTLDQKTLKEMLQRTAYAASADETRYILNGTLMSFRAGKVTLVATDGRRMALSEQELEFPKEAEIDLVVPTKAVNELLRILKDEGSVKVYGTKNQVAFECGDVLLISKLLEGAYPNFRQVIPTQCEERIAVERESFLTVVKRVAVLTTDRSVAVRLHFAKNRLEVSASCPEVGEARESMAIKYTGKELTVAFNPDFLMEPLRNLTSDEVYLEFTDELSPGVIKADVPFLYVLMPIRVS